MFSFNSVRKELVIAGRIFRLPESRWLRIALGVLFVFFGILGFLPVLGFWMIPVGLLILSLDFPLVRRWRRNLAVRFGRKTRAKAQNTTPPDPPVVESAKSSGQPKI